MNKKLVSGVGSSKNTVYQNEFKRFQDDECIFELTNWIIERTICFFGLGNYNYDDIIGIWSSLWTSAAVSLEFPDGALKVPQEL